MRHPLRVLALACALSLTPACAAIGAPQFANPVAAAHTIACGQAIRLRQRAGEVTPAMLGPGLAALVKASPMIEEDAPLDKRLNDMTAAIAKREWRFDWPDDAERAG